MPAYNFVCPKCEAIFTVIQPLDKDVPSPKCQICNVVMNRVYSVPSVKFMGTGWGKDRN